MEKRRFGSTGLELSLVGIGGIPFKSISTGEVERVILKGLDCGVNFVETARGYGSSEEKIGAALKGRRKDFIVITKGQVRRRDSSVVDLLDESLKALAVDYVDVYQLHGLMEGVLSRAEEGGVLDDLVKEGKKGKFRSLGITAHHPEAVYEALEYDIFSSIQAPINFVEYERYENCLKEAVKKDFGVLAMKPLGGGIFPARESLRFLKFTPVSAIPVGIRTPEEIEEDVLAVSGDEPLSAGEKERLQAELSFWGDKFCRKCGYCRGCPQGIPVSSLMLAEIIYYRNGIEEMKNMRYAESLRLSEKCTTCGECVKKCPYGLKIPETIKEYREKFLPLLEEAGRGWKHQKFETGIQKHAEL